MVETQELKKQIAADAFAIRSPLDSAKRLEVSFRLKISKGGRANELLATQSTVKLIELN